MKKFEFDADNILKAEVCLAKYPANRKKSAIIYLLDLAQRQNKGYLTPAVIEYIANFLDLTYIRVYEVASFYTMFNLEEVGEHLIQICRTTPCWLRGSDKITEICKNHLSIDLEGTSSDKKFTLKEVECLGACIDAPVVQINDDYYENLDEKSMIDLLDILKNGDEESLKNYQNNRSKNEV